MFLPALKVILIGAPFIFGTCYGQYLSPAATGRDGDSYLLLYIFLTLLWACVPCLLLFLILGLPRAGYISGTFINLGFGLAFYVVMVPYSAQSTIAQLESGALYFPFGYSAPTILFGYDPDFLNDLRAAYEERMGIRRGSLR